MTTFGFQIPGFRHAGAADGEMFDQTLAHALAAEEGGFASVWVMDHFWQLPALGGPDEPILEAYTLLGALAARTSRHDRRGDRPARLVRQADVLGPRAVALLGRG